MAEEKITLIPKREKPKRPPKTFIQIGVGILVFAILVFVGVKIYQRNLINNLTNLNSQLQTLIAKRDTALEKEILTADQRLSNLDNLLSNHIYSSKLFEFLEENTHPEVTLSGFSSNLKTISFSGTAVSLEVLSKQITIFSRSPEVSKVTLDSVSFSPLGGVSFGLTLEIKPELIKK